MDSIRRLDDHRPHYVIAGVKNVHVIPAMTLAKVASGELSIKEIDEYEDILPTIVNEWMGYVCNQERTDG